MLSRLTLVRKSELNQISLKRKQVMMWLNFGRKLDSSKIIILKTSYIKSMLNGRFRLKCELIKGKSSIIGTVTYVYTVSRVFDYI